MTLQELKDSKQIPNIGDSELIKIINEVFKVQPAISEMSYSLDDSMVEKIKYSPALMDMYIEQEMSKPGLDKSTQYSKVLEEIRKKQTELASKPGFEEEKKYLQQKERELAKKKLFTDSVMSTLDGNLDVLTNNIDLKSLQHLNKDALAIYLMSMMGKVNGLEQLLPLIQGLSSKVDELYAEVQKGKTTVATPDGSTHDEEKVEAPPKPEIIPEKKPETKVALNSLQDLKNKKKIPAGLSDADLIKYCNEVLKFNPPIKDMGYIMTQDKYNKLAQSVFFQNAKLKSEMQHEHKSVVDKYGTLIANYQSMLDRMQGHPEFADEVQKITELMNNLKAAQVSYKDAIVGLDAQNIEQYFDYPVSNREGISELVSGAAKGITTSQEEKAVELDGRIATLTGQVERLEKVSDKHLITRIRRDFNINRLNNKIERLRQKQGRIKSSQRRIINISTEMYRRRMEREFAKFEREQAKIDLVTQQKLAKVENLNAKKEEIDRISKKIVSLEERKKEVGAFGKLRIDGKKDRLEDRKKRIQAAVKRLETKVGKIDLSQQYETSFNDNFAFSM